MKGYTISTAPPKGYGKTRDGYKSARTNKYYTWINPEITMDDKKRDDDVPY